MNREILDEQVSILILKDQKGSINGLCAFFVLNCLIEKNNWPQSPNSFLSAKIVTDTKHFVEFLFIFSVCSFCIKIFIRLAEFLKISIYSVPNEITFN